MNISTDVSTPQDGDESLKTSVNVGHTQMNLNHNFPQMYRLKFHYPLGFNPITRSPSLKIARDYKRFCQEWGTPLCAMTLSLGSSLLDGAVSIYRMNHIGGRTASARIRPAPFRSSQERRGNHTWVRFDLEMF